MEEGGVIFFSSRNEDLGLRVKLPRKIDNMIGGRHKEKRKMLVFVDVLGGGECHMDVLHYLYSPNILRRVAPVTEEQFFALRLVLFQS